ncbi:MAG: DUF932 domain-containing protein [Spirochaetales bacterium]|nr:DUF932 domain-containing protein [Spirochaetales bacterium]
MEGNFKSLTELCQEIERQEKSKNDFLLSTAGLSMQEDKHLVIDTPDKPEVYELNTITHRQIADRLGIPRKYYTKMLDIPGLRTKNVNAWFKANPETRLVRTLDNKARAFLSDRYKPIDHYFIMSAFLPVLKEHGNLKVQSQALTDAKMYLQITFPNLEGEVKVGDVVRAGIVLTNSEVGCGAVDIKEMIWRLKCKNGMIGSSILNKYHVGRRAGENIEDYDIFKDDTIQAELESFRLRVRDVIAHALSEITFKQKLGKLQRALGDKIEAPVKTVENVTKRFGFLEREQEKILVNLTTGGEMNRWGLANSITSLAHDIESPDRQYDIEKCGNDIIELKPSEWEELSA